MDPCRGSTETAEGPPALQPLGKTAFCQRVKGETAFLGEKKCGLRGLEKLMPLCCHALTPTRSEAIVWRFSSVWQPSLPPCSSPFPLFVFVMPDGDQD